MRMRWIVLLLAGVAALVTTLRCAGRQRAPEGTLEHLPQAPSLPHESREPSALVPADSPAARAAPEASPAAREAHVATPSGPIRGRLIEDPGGAPVRSGRLVLLSSPDDRVAESVRTDASGGFVTTRAFPRGTVRAWVKHPRTRELLARHEAPFDPEASREWLVPVPSALPPRAEAASEDVWAELHGRVVTLGERGAPDALVRVFSLAEGSEGATTTDERGEFRLSGLRPGRHRVLALGAFAASEPVEVELEPGADEAVALFLPVAGSPGPIRGRLLEESGRGEPFGALLLRDPRSGRELVFLSEFKLWGDDEDGQTPFELRGVPPGEYELSVLAIDGRSYEPASLRVQPPCDGLEFRARAKPGRVYAMRVRDAVSGESLETVVFLGRIHGQWFGGEEDEPVPDAFERWLVYAPGYRSATGDFARAMPAGENEEGNEVLEIEVELARGFALAVLFKDASGSRLVAPELSDFIGDPLAGVQVFDGDELVAESDADGLALVDLPRAPESLHYGLAGWRVVGEDEEDGIRFVQMIRE
ncbi:MAG TPA: carboxypeptidase-like regulatory domain-containing protein [Planctomycetota bacterium]